MADDVVNEHDKCNHARCVATRDAVRYLQTDKKFGFYLDKVAEAENFLTVHGQEDKRVMALIHIADFIVDVGFPDLMREQLMQALIKGVQN